MPSAARVLVYGFERRRRVQFVEPTPQADDWVHDRVIGVPQGERWRPFEIELIPELEGRTLEDVDMPYFAADALVVKDRALPRAQELLGPYAEFLPLICEQEPLTLVNVVAEVDALDLAASLVPRVAANRVMRGDAFVFRREALPDEGVFVIPPSPGRRIFCTRPTALVLRKAFTGLELQPVWEG
ncbi:MAG TPA: hypothetical protein VFR07_04465 [Mycobacteriales bacterium]|nr:hypothetical protein [Mycobacteriales bacterium]